MRQVLGPGALGRPRGIGWRGRWEGGLGWGTHVNPWLFHFNVWQNPLQYKKKNVVYWKIHIFTGFPGGASDKEMTCQCRRLKRFPSWVGKIPWRGGHGNPLQYSCLENPMDRGAWRATVHRVTKSQTCLKRLSTHACVVIKSNGEQSNLEV